MNTVTPWHRQIARIYGVPLWVIVPNGWRLRSMHTDYGRRVRARRRRRRG